MSALLSRLGKQRVKWALAALLLALLAAGAYRTIAARKAQNQPPPATVSAGQGAQQVELADSDVVRLQAVQLVQGLPLSGTIKAENSAFVKARVAGELQGLNVREGDFVKAGQVLAHIDPGEYRLRLQQLQSQADAARAQVDIAQRQYANNKALVEQGFISKTALDTSLASLNAAQASYRAAVAGAEVSARSVTDAVLRAPISGQIAQRLAQPGERVGVDSRVVEIVDLSRLELEATVNGADSVTVQVGQRAELRVEGNAKPFVAHVARINPSAQAGSRNVLVYLSIDPSFPPNGTPDGRGMAASLRQGMFAQGTLVTGQALLPAVPLDSVRTDKPAPYLQLVVDGRVVHRAVLPGARGTVNGEPMVAVEGIGAPLPEHAVVVRGQIGTLEEGTVVRFTPQPGAAAQSQSLAGTRAVPERSLSMPVPALAASQHAP